jgi:hypothetical protein
MPITNPFTYGNPISDPGRFFGRRREVEQVFSRLRNPECESSAIVGERRTGKTSLLNFISHPEVVRMNGLDPNTCCFIYMDLEMITPTSTPTRFYQHLLNRLMSRVGDMELKERLREVAKYDTIDTYDLADLFDFVDQKGIRVVLLLDEFENIGANENFKPDFYYGLRALAIHHNLAIVTASRKDLLEISHSETVRSSPFFNIFATINLQPFSLEEVWELVRGSLAGTGVSFTDSEVRSIVRMAGRQPFFLQMAFHALFDAYQTGVEEGRRIAQVERAFLDAAHPHLQVYWLHSTDEERIVLSLLGILSLLEGEENIQLVHWSSSMLERWYSNPGPILNGLARRGLVSRTDDQYALFSTALARWVVRELTSIATEGTDAEEMERLEERLLGALPGDVKGRIVQWTRKINTKYRPLLLKWMSDPRTAEPTYELLTRAPIRF